LSISRNTTSGDLHGFRLGLISDLGGGTGSNNILPLIDISTYLSVDSGGGLFTDGENTIKAIVIINNLLNCKCDWGHLLSKGRNTDLSIDRGVGVSAGICGSIGWCITIARSCC